MDVNAISSRVLGRVTGGVRIGQHGGCIVAELVYSHDADAGADPVFTILPAETKTVDLSQYGLGGAITISDGTMLQQHTEFITAKPS